MHVIVIGAGVIGLALATALVDLGVEVTIVDQAAPGSGTTATSYAWVNSNGKGPRPYFELNLAGVREFHRQLPDLKNAFTPSGHLEIAVEAAAATRLESRVAELKEAGNRAELITAAAAQELEVDLLVPPASTAIAHFADEGYCDTRRLVALLYGRAREHDARIRTRARVVDVRATRQRVDVVLESGARVSGDRAVLCTGRWTAALTAAIGREIPMVDPTAAGSTASGFLAITRVVAARVRGLVSIPGLNLRPYGHDRLMLQALDLDVRAGDADAEPAVIDIMTSRARASLRTDRNLQVASLLTGLRALPLDGLTVAGWLDTACCVYALVTHSGITLSLLLGSLVAAEVATEVEAPYLKPFRPGRFFADE